MTNYPPSLPQIVVTDDSIPAPSGKLDIERYDVRTLVKWNDTLVAVRSELDGSIVWYDPGEKTRGGTTFETIQTEIRLVFDTQLVWAGPPAPGAPMNRAQKRAAKHARKARRRG